jgi:hypothetical protein
MPEYIIANKKAAPKRGLRNLHVLSGFLVHLPHCLENAEEEYSMDHNGNNVQGRIGRKQKDRQITGIEHQADNICGFRAARGKESQSHKGPNSDGIQRQDKANWCVRRDSADGQAESEDNGRLAENQYGIDCGERRNYKENVSLQSTGIRAWLNRTGWSARAAGCATQSGSVVKTVPPLG